MKTIKGYFYTYAISDHAGGVDYQISDTRGMESQGWMLIDEREISIEVEDINYADVFKKNQIDNALLRQEKINAELLELTS